jgi:hypothetical protein
LVTLGAAAERCGAARGAAARDEKPDLPPARPAERAASACPPRRRSTPLLSASCTDSTEAWSDARSHRVVYTREGCLAHSRTPHARGLLLSRVCVCTCLSCMSRASSAARVSGARCCMQWR